MADKEPNSIHFKLMVERQTLTSSWCDIWTTIKLWMTSIFSTAQGGKKCVILNISNGTQIHTVLFFYEINK